MLDARAKLLLALSGGLVVSCTHHAAWLAGEWAVVSAGVLALGRGRDYTRCLAVLVPTTLFFGALTGWSAGAAAGAAAGLGLVTLTTVFFLFFAVTTPEDLGDALGRAGVPFPVVFVLCAALQFVPSLRRKAQAVTDAQRARGIPLELGRSALRHYPALLLPLLLQAFQLAEELAEAMEARGFGRPGRSFVQESRFGGLDWAAVGVSALLAAAALYLAAA